MSPVLALTATSSPHGGSEQLQRFAGSQNRPPSGVTLPICGGAFGLPPRAAAAAAASSGGAPRGATASPPAGLQMPPLAAVITFVMIKPSGLLKAEPCQLPPPCAPGKTRMSWPTRHGS